jgi:hypothetical protein
MTESIENNIRNRIYGHGRGWCFTIDHFSDFNNNEAVKKALQRLEQSSLIRRLAKGLYEYPRQHKKLGILPPEIEQIAKAISEKDHVRVQASGAYAANLIGLSEQVPGKVVFDTEGVPKNIKIGKLQIAFRRTTPKNMVMSGTKMGLIVQALRHIGRDRITEKIKQVVRKQLCEVDTKEFHKGLKYAPTWARELIGKISKGIS